MKADDHSSLLAARRRAGRKLERLVQTGRTPEPTQDERDQHLRKLTRRVLRSGRDG